MAMTEDFTLFFDDSEFADAAVLISSASGLATPGKLIFDANGLTLDDYEVQTTGPTALCHRGSWAAAREGDVVSIAFADGGLTYRLRSVTPIGDGKLQLLHLTRIGPAAIGIASQLLLDGDQILLSDQYLVFVV